MPAEKSTFAPSSLRQYLPAIYWQDPFLGQFLLAFEKLLLGLGDDVPLPHLEDGVEFPAGGLEATIDRLSSYFDPQQTPAKFLPWLASWAALSLRADLTETQQRDFIGNAIRLYRRRGTLGNMEELLLIFTGQTATVRDDLKEPHRFEVGISFAERDKDLIARQQAIAHALIVLEKPAHTLYDLILYFPSMEIGQCRVGDTTLLSTSRPPKEIDHG